MKWPRALLPPFIVVSLVVIHLPSAAGAPPLDGQRAFRHVAALVAFGPRDPGSPGIRKAQRYIIKTLKGYGLQVREQDFTASTPLGQIPMKNIIGVLPGTRPGIIAIASHYDTKRYERFRFVGANDGGSSTGLLLELARSLSRRNKGYTIWFVFFDGEEALVSWNQRDSLYGSRYMVKELSAQGRLKEIKALILLDMVGDRDLDVRRARSSTRWLTQVVWSTARKLGLGNYFPDEDIEVEDDHTPFVMAGVAAIDLIDFNYGTFWHTAADTLDKVSAASLKRVGTVLLESLPAIEANIAASESQ